MGVLDQKVALITGAAGGIGRATSKLFIDEGAKVVMVDIWDEMGEKTAGELGPNAIYVHGDVSQESDIKKSIDLAVEKFGRLDIVFSNAGNPGTGGSIENVEVEGFDYDIAVHLRAAFLYMKLSIPIMKKQGSGCFICTGSVAGFQQGMGGLSYSLCKAALIHLVRIAAVELGIFGIRANTIAPGGIATGIFGQGIGLSREKAEEWAEIRKEIMANVQPIRRAGLPEDIANAALFLASEASSFITGITLKVDGGLLSGRIPQDNEENEIIWNHMFSQLEPADQKMITELIQEGAQKAAENLKYIKPEIRERILKREQRVAERRAARQKATE
ncbi:MAG: SDR family NAD(P)-dependent oxidoreductase [Promethearchaeota archaeon]|jgi:NAD(P)-dependent dehydrogenase (short-subunit alcohol dehydrogenase family)